VLETQGSGNRPVRQVAVVFDVEIAVRQPVACALTLNQCSLEYAAICSIVKFYITIGFHYPSPRVGAPEYCLLEEKPECPYSKLPQHHALD
jgi:hypothetical protein